MTRIFSNGLTRDYVLKPYASFLASSERAYLAAPYFTKSEEIAVAAKKGTAIQLIVGLNGATSPNALAAVIGQPNLAVRYFTGRFHAKIYIFDGDRVLLGSSNLTDGGMVANREAVISLTGEDNWDAIEETMVLFADLWESAHVLTPEILKSFSGAWDAHAKKAPNVDAEIERSLGKAHPTNINVASWKKSTEHLFLQGLRRQVYEQYQPAFNEVDHTLTMHGLHRDEFEAFGTSVATNRFLNWVRLAHAPGDDAWRSAKLGSAEERAAKIVELGQEWKTTADDKMAKDYFDRLETVRSVFSSLQLLEAATKEEVATGLLGVHAFLEQLRFVKGGESALPTAFWKENSENLARVRNSLGHLLYGPDDFIKRLHDLIYDRHFKLGYFGRFCALELVGTIKPKECPPMNGRMAKALRFVGFDVKAN